MLIACFAAPAQAQHWSVFSTANLHTLPSNVVHCFLFPDDSTAYIGTDNGLVKMNIRDSSLQIYNSSNSGIAGNDITCMKMDSSGKLFLWYLHPWLRYFRWTYRLAAF
jgi:ligand-binding sensor domain-containing protein